MNFHHTAPRHLIARLPVLVPVALALTIPLSSCSVTSGAAIGGLIGAGLGQAAGGNTESTVVGAAIGAGIGAAIGFNVEKKREARLLASRRATEAELEAAQRESSAVTASARDQAVARAEAYEKEHRDEHRAAAVDGRAIVPSSKGPATGTDRVDGTQDPAVESGETAPQVRQPQTEPQTEPLTEPLAMSIPDDTLIGVVPLPTGGVVFTDVKTGELLDQEVHQLGEIKDVSGGQSSTAEETDAPKPFTLILSDKQSGKTRQYTAIYSS